MSEFRPFPKISRFSRPIIITEKLDGTNASVWISETTEEDEVSAEECGWPLIVATDEGHLTVRVGSRKRFVLPNNIVKGADNFGFANWVRENVQELVKLGIGTHFGEWWGQGIQRKYGLDEKRFSLFNVGRWYSVHDGIERLLDANSKITAAPVCCHVVPILRTGDFTTDLVWNALNRLENEGSRAAPGFMKPEGIVIFHTHNGALFKKTFEGDDTGKERMAA